MVKNEATLHGGIAEGCESLSAQPDAMENMRRRRCVDDHGSHRDDEHDRPAIERHRHGGDEVRRHRVDGPLILAPGKVPVRNSTSSAARRGRSASRPGSTSISWRAGSADRRVRRLLRTLPTLRRLGLGDGAARDLSGEAAPSWRQRHRDAEQGGCHRFREQGAHAGIIPFAGSSRQSNRPATWHSFFRPHLASASTGIPRIHVCLWS